MSQPVFEGFPADTLRFLRALKRNNNREWFQEHKQRYESSFLAPSLAFIEAIERPLKRVSPCLTATARKSGGSLMRIYRDTRFSKDKTPYKTNIGIHFRHVTGCDVHAPGCYVHVEPGASFLGVGTWRPDSRAAKMIRSAIAEETAAWKRASRGSSFRALFELAGDRLKRPPRGFDPDHPCVEDLKRKDFIGIRPISNDELESADFLEDTVASFRKARPWMRFLCEALGVPF